MLHREVKMETERPVIRYYGGPFGGSWWLAYNIGELGLHPKALTVTEVFWARA